MVSVRYLREEEERQARLRRIQESRRIGSQLGVLSAQSYAAQRQKQSECVAENLRARAEQQRRSRSGVLEEIINHSNERRGKAMKAASTRTQDATVEATGELQAWKAQRHLDKERGDIAMEAVHVQKEIASLDRHRAAQRRIEVKESDALRNATALARRGSEPELPEFLKAPPRRSNDSQARSDSTQPRTASPPRPINVRVAEKDSLPPPARVVAEEVREQQLRAAQEAEETVQLARQRAERNAEAALSAMRVERHRVEEAARLESEARKARKEASNASARGAFDSGDGASNEYDFQEQEARRSAAAQRQAEEEFKRLFLSGPQRITTQAAENHPQAGNRQNVAFQGEGAIGFTQLSPEYMIPLPPFTKSDAMQMQTEYEDGFAAESELMEDRDMTGNTEEGEDTEADGAVDLARSPYHALKLSSSPVVLKVIDLDGDEETEDDNAAADMQQEEVAVAKEVPSSTPVPSTTTYASQRPPLPTESASQVNRESNGNAAEEPAVGENSDEPAGEAEQLDTNTMNEAMRTTHSSRKTRRESETVENNREEIISSRMMPPDAPVPPTSSNPAHTTEDADGGRGGSLANESVRTTPARGVVHPHVTSAAAVLRERHERFLRDLAALQKHLEDAAVSTWPSEAQGGSRRAMSSSSEPLPSSVDTRQRSSSSDGSYYFYYAESESTGTTQPTRTTTTTTSTSTATTGGIERYIQAPRRPISSSVTADRKRVTFSQGSTEGTQRTYSAPQQDTEDTASNASSDEVSLSSMSSSEAAGGSRTEALHRLGRKLVQRVGGGMSHSTSSPASSSTASTSSYATSSGSLDDYAEAEGEESMEAYGVAGQESSSSSALDSSYTTSSLNETLAHRQHTNSMTAQQLREALMRLKQRVGINPGTH